MNFYAQVTKIHACMSQNQTFLAELKQQAASTRKLLALVPMEKGDWKPQEKSMTRARLANHA